jgi:hypothetical protein
MRLLSYMFWLTLQRWMNTSSNTPILQAEFIFYILCWPYSNLLVSCSKFREEQWKSRINPTDEQLKDLMLNGWKSSRGKRGPNFFDWFKEKVILLKHFKLPFSINLLHTITYISYYHEFAVHANRRHGYCLVWNILWFS